MKTITIKFEVKKNTDVIAFEDCLLKAMDNWNESELDKCTCVEVIKVKGEKKK